MTPHATAPTEDEREAAVLRHRAALLARPVATSAAGEQLLAFAVAGQRCLIPIAFVCEVLPSRDLMPVPLAPAALMGLVHLRGRMLPVLDIAGLLRLPGQESTGGRMLVLGRGRALFAILASEVHGLHPLAPLDTDRRSQPLADLRPELLRGITADGHLLLDGERLLTLHGSAGSALHVTMHHEEN